jgi:hypothetical protein
LANEVPSNARLEVNLNSTTDGASLAVPMSTTQMVYLTGGVGASAASSGTITGYVTYFVTDPLIGQQND